MRKNIFLLCLVFGVVLSANTSSEIVSKKVEAGKNQVLEHTYYKNGTLKSFDIARTNVQKGTYTQYHENGNLKSFTIIR